MRTQETQIQHVLNVSQQLLFTVMLGTYTESHPVLCFYMSSFPEAHTLPHYTGQ